MSFHNPYNFVPAVVPTEAQTGLSQFAPVGHEAYYDGHYTGSIEVLIEAKTPLLLPDTSKTVYDRNGHGVFETLKDKNGLPILKGTALKGALRSAYEAITNSRFGVFGGEYKVGSRSLPRGAKIVAPIDLLPRELRPAVDMSKLSPADRVFGWVSNSRQPESKRSLNSSYRGQLRIAKVNIEACAESKNANSHTDIRVPLAILATPKPKQARFYGSSDKAGAPLRDGTSKADAIYVGDNVKGLRGRKFYLHSDSPSPSYWDFNLAPASAAWRAQGSKAAQSSQNRSIKDWIAPGTTFRARIDVVNLNGAELGALLWLLKQGEDDKTFLKIGGGKPLGFGSILIKVSSADLRDGAAYRHDLLSWGRKDAEGRRLAFAGDCCGSELAMKLIDEFLSALGTQCGELNADRITKSFQRVCRGPNDDFPVRYPYVRNGKAAYQWFVRNDTDNFKGKRSLPPLWELQPLPVFDAQGGGHPHGGKHGGFNRNGQGGRDRPNNNRERSFYLRPARCWLG